MMYFYLNIRSVGNHQPIKDICRWVSQLVQKRWYEKVKYQWEIRWRFVHNKLSPWLLIQEWSQIITWFSTNPIKFEVSAKIAVKTCRPSGTHRVPSQVEAWRRSRYSSNLDQQATPASLMRLPTPFVLIAYASRWFFT